MNRGKEREYQRLKRLGQRLGIPIFEAFLELEVKDAAGEVIRRHRQRSHSWVRNAYNVMFSQLAGKDLDDYTYGAGLLSIKDSTGYVRFGNRPYGMMLDESVDSVYGYRAAAAQDICGILVGSGTDAEDFEDNFLQTQIEDGTGTGELSHVLSEAHSVSYVAGTKTLTNELVRYFNNNSGGSIDVNELVLSVWNDHGGHNDRFIVSRDKLASTVAVPDTGQLKVTYTISLVYPA